MFKINRYHLTESQRARYREILFTNFVLDLQKRTKNGVITLRYIEAYAGLMQDVDYAQLYTVINNIFINYKNCCYNIRKDLILLMYCSGMTVRAILREMKLASGEFYRIKKEYEADPHCIGMYFTVAQNEAILNFLRQYHETKELI